MRNEVVVLIVEDELQNRTLLRFLLSRYFPDITQIMEAENLHEAKEILKQENINILFLDIHLKGQDGFYLLDAFPDLACQIIFVTADQNMAIRAFKYCALDYLTKPVDDLEFKKAVARALKQIMLNPSDVKQQLDLFKAIIKSPKKSPDRIQIPTSEGIHFVKPSDIIYCQAESNYTRFIFIDSKKIISSHHLGYYNDLLEEIGFIRVHRSFLVNPDHIQLYKKGDGGTIVLTGDFEIDVSRSYKDVVLKIVRQ